MFFSKKIKVDIYTSARHAYEINPIEKSVKFIPKWFKDLPKDFFLENNFFPTSTMRRCPGIIDLYTKGFIVPMWSDLAIKTSQVHETIEYQFADNRSQIEFHNHQQRGDYLNYKQYNHFKIICPWYVETNEDIDWMMVPCTWNHNPFDYHISLGTMNLHRVPFLNIQCFVPYLDKTFIIEQGTPMIQLVPLSSKPIDLKLHLITPEELDHKRKSNRISFTDSYRKVWKKRKDLRND